jgi:phosphate-selective porin
VPAFALLLVIGVQAAASEAPDKDGSKAPADKVVAKAPQDQSADLALLRTLRDKGILTAEEYDALVLRAQKAQNADEAAQKKLDDALARFEKEGAAGGEPKKDEITIKHKPGGGFTFETADKRFSTTIGGWAQIRSQYEEFDDSDLQSEWKFEVKRARIFLEGFAFEEWFRYKFEFDLVGQNEVSQVSVVRDGAGNVTDVTVQRTKVTELKDGYFDIVPYEEFGVKVGQFKVPYSRQEMISDSRQALPERSITNDVFTFSRDQGMDFHGGFEKRFFYDLGIYNGAGELGAGENRASNPQGSQMLYNARASFMAMGDDPKYLFEQSGDTKRSENPLWGLESAWVWDTGDTTISELELSTIFKGYGVGFEGAYLARYINPDTGLGGEQKSGGYYAQIGYMFTEHIEGVYRNAYVHFSGGAHWTENTLGCNYYFYDHNLKLQASYSRLYSQPDQVTPVNVADQDLWILQLQARF